MGVNLGLGLALIGGVYMLLTFKAKTKPKKKSEHERERARRDFMMKALGKRMPESASVGPISGLPGFTSDVRFVSG